MNAAIRIPKTTRHLDYAQKIARGELPGPPVAELIGFRIVEVDVGRAVMDMHASKRHANPMGTLHGGIICDLADAAMGVALSSTLEDDETFTTIDLTTNYFKPIWNAHLKAVGRVTRRTRQLGFIECEVFDDDGSLVAKVFSTCMVLRGLDAKGR
jgi:uncharacterized protein (TIGR00369 family)